MISYDEALAAIADLGPVDARETLPLAAARSRFLAAPVALDRDQPAFDRATMDGYAVALAAGQDQFRVIGTIHAGDASTLAPAPGEAVRIMTGAACPPGVTVVPIEITDGARGRFIQEILYHVARAKTALSVGVFVPGDVVVE